MHTQIATPHHWPQIKGLLSRLALPLDGAQAHLQHYQVIELGGELLAVAGLELHPPYALLRSVAVAPQHQGKGLGGQLTESLIQHAKTLGITDLYLLTTTAGKYFPRYGFKTIPRTEVPEPLRASAEFQGACPDSATVMHLPLQVDTAAADLLRQVTRLHHQLQQLTTSCAGTESLTRCHILTELGKAGQLTLADLVGRLRLDKAWLSRNVDSLLRDGLLSKHPHDTDRRASWIRLTEAGEKQLHELNCTLNGQTSRILAHIPRTAHPQVLEALHTLHDALQTEFELASKGQKGPTA